MEIKLKPEGPKPEMPSESYLIEKLSRKKASKRSLRRQLRVLTDKLTREHVRKLYKSKFDEERAKELKENAWKSLT